MNDYERDMKKKKFLGWILLGIPIVPILLTVYAYCGWKTFIDTAVVVILVVCALICILKGMALLVAAYDR